VEGLRALRWIAVHAVSMKLSLSIEIKEKSNKWGRWRSRKFHVILDTLMIYELDWKELCSFLE
jgi:hypothetical protein